MPSMTGRTCFGNECFSCSHRLRQLLAFMRSWPARTNGCRIFPSASSRDSRRDQLSRKMPNRKPSIPIASPPIAISVLGSIHECGSLGIRYSIAGWHGSARFGAYPCATHKRLPCCWAWSNGLVQLRRPGRLKAANRGTPSEKNRRPVSRTALAAGRFSRVTSFAESGASRPPAHGDYHSSPAQLNHSANPKN